MEAAGGRGLRSHDSKLRPRAEIIIVVIATGDCRDVSQTIPTSQIFTQSLYLLTVLGEPLKGYLARGMCN